MSGGGTKTQTVTQASAPWAGQQAYLSDGFDIARQNLANAASGQIGQYYPGQTYTPADWKTNEGTSALFARGATAGTTNGQVAEQVGGRTAANLLQNGAFGGGMGGNVSNNIANGNYSQWGGNLLNSTAAAMPGNIDGYARADVLGQTAAGQGMQANPFQSQMVQQAFQAVRPGIDSAFASTGRLGSGAYGNAMADAAARAASQIGYQNYATERQNQLSAANQLLSGDLAARGNAVSAANTAANYGLANTNLQRQAANDLTGATLGAFQTGGQLSQQASQNDANNLNAMLQAGQITEGYGDKALTADINRWNYQQNAPWNMLSNYMGLINGNYGTSNTTTQPVYGNQALSSLFGGASALGGLASGAGALVTALSDARAKENIKPVGALDNGLTVYAYNYKGDHVPQIGLLAQEVAEVRPEAVGHHGGGLLGVNYDLATR